MKKQPTSIYQKPWYVYMLRCQHIFIYTGISPDVQKRLQKHRSGTGARFTKNKHPIELVFVEKCENVQEALVRERMIKKLPKPKKEMLIQIFQTNVSTMQDTAILAQYAI